MGQPLKSSWAAERLQPGIVRHALRWGRWTHACTHSTHTHHTQPHSTHSTHNTCMQTHHIYMCATHTWAAQGSGHSTPSKPVLELQRCTACCEKERMRSECAVYIAQDLCQYIYIYVYILICSSYIYISYIHTYIYIRCISSLICIYIYKTVYM